MPESDIVSGKKNSENITENRNIADDPGVIFMPIVNGRYVIEKDTDEYDAFGPDKVSQTSVGCNWPETPLDYEERMFVRNRVKEIVSSMISSDMSDIEKYWTLAEWVYTNIEYKNVPEKQLEHDTSHGSYCALKNGYAVCQGLGFLYSHLCHEADLPCDEIALGRNGASSAI